MKHWTKIVLFGDSLTQLSFSTNDGCWGALLSDRMQRVSDVFNRGFSGYNTAYCKLILPEILKEFDAKEISVFTLCLGANDANAPSSIQHVPLEAYEKNLNEMLTIVKNHGIDMAKVIMLSPPPYCVEKWEAECLRFKGKPSLDNGNTALYVAACSNVAKSAGVDFVNLHFEMMKEKEWTSFLSDGLHFSRSGAQFVYEKLLPLVESKVLKHRGSLEPSYPLWSDIDPKDPSKTLLAE